MSLGDLVTYRNRLLVVIATRQDGRIVGIFKRDQRCKNYVFQVVDARDLTEPQPEPEPDPATLAAERARVKAQLAAARDILRRMRALDTTGSL